jgi:hypothetical protein
MSSSLVVSHTLEAQARVGGRNEVFAGSELESYLRYLQTLGKSESYPWSIRALSPSEIDSLAPADSTLPWARRYDLERRTARRGFEWDYVRPQATFYLNTAYPFGGNDGAVWQGKGLTSSLQGGVSARWGPFSAVIAPIAFRAENQSFPLMRNGETGRGQFADGVWPQYIDKPQRFGTAPYSRVDPGQSTIRFDGFGVAAGVSTANQWWGPTDEYPFILGDNAPGFPNVFFGTSHPADIWIAKLHARLVYGRLDQSDYSPVTGTEDFTSFSEPGTRRFMAGLVAAFQPRGAPGLEIGGARFFHSASDPLGYFFSVKQLKLPFQGLFKSGLPAESDTVVVGGSAGLKENQLASVFLRWAPPGSGFDLYGEYGREDHSADRRDLVIVPDHSATMNIGFRKAWASPGVMRAVRGEVFTYESAAGSRKRGEGQTYLNGILRQGHTERGQILGANVGAGSGSAQMIAFDRFADSGRLTVFASRETQHELRAAYSSGPAKEKVRDVLNSLGIEGTRFVGPLDVLARVVLAVDVNRNLRADRANGNFVLGVRQGF